MSSVPRELFVPEELRSQAYSDRSVPLGLYLHIPFCRKRCHFCYFRVYTDKNAREVQQYLDLLVREWELYAATPAIHGRKTNFVYFGGGTPSFLSTSQLEGLVTRLTAVTEAGARVARVQARTAQAKKLADALRASGAMIIAKS